MAPKILRIWKEFVNSSNSWRLFCEAKAKPAPNITLWNPNGDFMFEVSMDQNYPNKLQQIIGDYNITEEDAAGNYSCLVMNIHGTAREYILYEGARRMNPQIITTVVACSIFLCIFLLIFTIGIYIYRKKWKLQEGERFELNVFIYTCLLYPFTDRVSCLLISQKIIFFFMSFIFFNVEANGGART